MMHEVARVTLKNEMDLILAHRRSMKLAELAGLSLSAQTTFATAVSEVSRSTIESEKGGCLILNVDTDGREKYIVASLQDKQGRQQKQHDGLVYAKRLVNKFNISSNDKESSVDLYYYISPSFRIDVHKLDEWRMLFRNEPPVSPYDELKRKNEQLQELSEKIQKSERQYKTLTNSLPLMIFSLDQSGQILYANEWLTKYTGESTESLNQNRWRSVVHEDDYESFLVLLKTNIAKGITTIRTQARLKHKNSDEYLWHQVSISPLKDDVPTEQFWIGYIVDIHSQKVLEETLKDNKELKQTQDELKDNQHKLEIYIEELNRSNKELQQFAFVASHDLQEPVRKLLFYSDFLVNRYRASLDTKGIDYLQNLQVASRRMRNLIQDLLLFSQINRNDLQMKDVSLNDVATVALQDLEIAIREKKASIKIHPLPVIQGDERMMRQLFENIISNSLKYSTTLVQPEIEIGCTQDGTDCELFFKDNGIGFDEQYLPKIFTLFQRLHDRKTYEGTGLGLAICQKIVDIHKGKIWAASKEGEGAVFYVSIPMAETTS